MKKNGFTLAAALVACLLVMSCFSCTSTGKIFSGPTESYYTLEQDVYFPKNMDSLSKYPVVFFAHNGFADRNAWGDFPAVVASEGFIAVNISWKNWDTSNVEDAIAYSLKKYAANIDTEKVVFIGGCHGSKDFLQIMSKKDLPYTVKTAVILSLSENDEIVAATQKIAHVPLLSYYSKNDVLGKEYQDINKTIAENVLTQPKTVYALDESAHGNDLVTQAATKADIRAKIINWIKYYTK